MFKSKYLYEDHEAILFKLVFPTYSKRKMHLHGFDEEEYDTYEWEYLNKLRKRKRNIKLSKDFFGIPTIKRVWLGKTGFFYSEEMK